MPPVSDGSPRLLISRLSAIGDCLLTLPLLCALRDQFPGAHIGWVVEPAAAPLLHGHSCLDELIVVNRGWLKSPRQVWALRRRLRASAFDVAIDPQSLTKSAMVGWLSGARRRIGLAAPAGRELSPRLNNQLVTVASSHLVDQQLETLGMLDVERPTRVRFDVPRDAEAERRMAAFLGFAVGREPAVVMNVGAGWASRQWSSERYAEVARRLGRARRAASIVVWEGEHERRLAEAVTAAADGHAVLAPRTTLPELAALLRAGRLYVGSDTGPMHLAAAVGTACVALHGTTLPEKSGPYGSGHRTIQRFYQAGTSRQRRQAPNTAMMAITADEVVAACEQQLRLGAATQAA